MSKEVSPKQLARTIGVSEASVKRWCDGGRLRVLRTAGGHRRIPIDAALKFMREEGYANRLATVLELPSVSSASSAIREEASRGWLDAVLAGDEARAKQIILDLYLAGNSIAEIGDETIAPAFSRIGDLWHCEKLEIYQERRSCEIAKRTLNMLREHLPPLAETAPFALGAALEGDHYELPTNLVDVTLRELGWNAESLGCNLPINTVNAAIARIKPRLAWISISHVEQLEQLVEGFDALSAVAAENKTAIVVGGRGLTQEIRKRIRFAANCESLREFSEFVKVLV